MASFRCCWPEARGLDWHACGSRVHEAIGSGMRRFRRRFTRILDELEIPSNLDLRAFCEGLRRTHGLDVVLVPVATRPDHGACGWLAHSPDDSRVLVLYEANTSTLHRVLIALHEISHRLLGHEGTELLTDEFLDLVAPDVDLGVARRVLGRSAFTDAQEAEAEMLATMLLTTLMRAGRGRTAAGEKTDDTARRVSRLAAVLEGLDVKHRW